MPCRKKSARGYWRHVVPCALACAACGEPRSPRPSPSPSPPASADIDRDGRDGHDGRDAREAATRLVRAYAARFELGSSRGPPTDAEVAAAALAEPPDESIDAAKWKGLPPAWRLNEAFEAHQRALWLSACRTGVGRWFDRAHAIDGELQARLESASLPGDFYAGSAALNEHRTWLRKALASDPAFQSILQLANVGPAFRLVSAQNAWAELQPPLERAIAEIGIGANSWSLEDRATEATRFCGAAEGRGPRTWPIHYGLAALKPAVPLATAPPAREEGTVAQIRKQGTEWLVTRRDRTTTIELVPPCRRVHCEGLDCCMTPMGCWRDVCSEKETAHVKDYAFVVEFGSLPIRLSVGDVVSFYAVGATGHAVLARASKKQDQPPFFDLGRDGY